jgi:LysR family glycine cleavage system transcriptional activator
VKYNLPSLKALRAVETVGRHGSIASAATELNVSPGAISRHITLLEEYFGCKLFFRHAKGLTLTEVGRQYVDRLSDAFGLIDQASSKLFRVDDRKTLNIRALGSFSTEWLLKRLVQFEKEYPEISVCIQAQKDRVDFATDDADMGIIASQYNPRSVNAMRLITPYITPVMSAELLEKGPAVEKVGDLRHYKLLHAKYPRPTWQQWVEQVDPESELDSKSGHWLERTSQVSQAIQQGAGVGLRQLFLAGDELLDGSLVAPINVAVPSPFMIYFVWPKQRTAQPEIELFKEWLIETVRENVRRLKRELPELQIVSTDD